MIIKYLKQLIVTGFIFICSYLEAQGNPTTVTMQLLNPTVSMDTAASNKNKKFIRFTLNVKLVDDLKSFTVNLVDKDGKVVTSLGSFEAKRHENGFYYVESELKEKKTVLGNDIYFVSATDSDNLARIKTITLTYYSKLGQESNVTIALPNGN